jgi:hypothetical protein
MFSRKIVTCLLISLCIAAADIITTSITAGTVEFHDDAPVIRGFGKLQIPGTPVLPAQSVMFALPPGAVVTSITVHAAPAHILESTGFAIAPPSLPLSLDKEAAQEALDRWSHNRSAIESLENTFPAQPVYHSKTTYFRNIPCLRISYFPLLFTRGRLLFYPSADITVQYTCEPAVSTIPEWVDRRASLFFTNWDEIRGQYRISAQTDSFEYVIIAKDNMFSAFDSLVAWKNSLGFSTRLMSYDSIISQYPGTDNADRIRNFLIDKYLAWGIQYVLIAGNVDAIPMKICFPDAAHEYDTPTDYYFAELTDDWDSDGDGYYGEYDQDSIGFVPEIMVGRFPYDNPAMLSSIAEKTVHFEMDTGPWKNRALLLGAFSNFANENHTGWPDCDGAVVMENIKDSLLAGWECTRLYEEAGLCPSIHPHEGALTGSQVVAEWSSGAYAITNWSGHGNSGGAYRKVWAWDDGDSVPEYFEIESEPFIYMTDPASLDDAHPSIVFSASCSNAAGDDNLARNLIGNGASGVVAATTYGWYTPGWEDPSDGNIMSLEYYFNHYLIGEDEPVGDALFDAKMYYFTYLYFPDPWGGDPDWTPQQNMLDYVLFGDPSLKRAGVGIEEIVSDTPAQYSFGVLPNPVRSRGALAFTLTCDADVTVSLYNVAGQRVKMMYQAHEPAGQHVLYFTRDGLSAGVYFIRMECRGENTGTVTADRKVIVL